MHRMKGKVLCTGATGFIGSHLIPELEDLGYDVWALLRYVTGRRITGQKVKSVFADIRDPVAVRQAIRLVQPDYVIHLAAISPVSYSYEKPQEVTETNYIGTINLAEACLRECPAFKGFLFAGTSEEYGNQDPDNIPINEEAFCHPNSPYSVAKHAATNYLEYMRDAYEFPMTVLRPFNTYGRVKNTHFVTERIITQMLNQVDQVRLGDPTPIRDMMFRQDHINAYLRCLEAPDTRGMILNFCTGVGTSIEDLALKIAELTGYEGTIEWNTIPARPLDIDVLIGDNGNAYRFAGWRPNYNLDTGLTLTIEALKT